MICQIGQLPPGARDFIFEYGHSFPAGATVELGAIVIQPNVDDEPDTENNKAVSRVVPAPQADRPR